MKSFLATSGLVVSLMVTAFFGKTSQPVNPITINQLVSQGKSVVQVDAQWNAANHYKWNTVPDAKYYELSLDQYPEVKAKYNIKSLPTLIVFLNGKEIKRYEGGLMFKINVPQQEILR